MIRGGAFVLTFIALSFGMAAAGAQDTRVRLDDLAIPQTGAAGPLEQVTRREPAAPTTEPPDRAILQPERPRGAPVTASQQVAPTAPGGSVSQVTNRAQSRTALTGARADPLASRPGGVQRIGGQDRCDPQLATGAYRECLRILERRAGDFSAPQPTPLSPEQRLLVGQRDGAQGRGAAPSARSIRQAAGIDPDADLASNQELASVYLGKGEIGELPAAADAGKDAGVAQILQILGVETPTPPPPQ